MNAPFADEVVQVTELRRNLSSYLEKARQGRPVSIVQGNRADLVIVRRDDVAEAYSEAERAQKLLEQLDSWIETREIAADEDLMDKIRRSEEDIVAGRYVTLDELKAKLDV